MRLCSASLGIADSEKKKEEEEEEEDEEEDDYRSMKKKSLYALTRAGERLLKIKKIRTPLENCRSPTGLHFRPLRRVKWR